MIFLCSKTFIIVMINSSQGNRPSLLVAAEEGWTDIIEDFIADGADMDTKDSVSLKGYCIYKPVAVEKGRTVVRILLMHGANVNAMDKVQNYLYVYLYVSLVSSVSVLYYVMFTCNEVDGD